LEVPKRVRKRLQYIVACIMVALMTISGILPSIPYVKAAETAFNFNATDTYLSVTSYNGKPGVWLLQIDGNNPSAGVKFEKQLPSSVTTIDSIAMSKDGTELYGIKAEDNTFIYKINEAGNVTVQPVTMPSGLQTFKPQGGGAIDPMTGHYALFVRDMAQRLSRIVLIDPNTGAVTDGSISPNNRINLRDIIFDDQGNIYYIDASNEEWVRYDRTTGKETVYGRVGNIPLTTPGHGAGLSYLPSNELLIVFTRGDLFASNPKDNNARHLVQIPNINFLSDAASAVFPYFFTDLKAEKFVNGSQEVSSVKRGDLIEYKIVVSNAGNLPADNVVLKDSIPEGTEYIANSTKINGTAISDINGQSPLVAGLKIKSSADNANDGVILNGEENAATITFQVRVKDDAAFDTTILNTATVTSSEGEIESNEVVSSVTYNSPVLESKKSVVIEQKAPGNLDVQHPEVGDTLSYTIETRNTTTDSLVKNLVISDVVPAELQYVAGSLMVDGVSVTDAEGDDEGHYANGKVTGQFGDVTDTGWHTVQFKAVVQPGQAGKDIINIATVGGDNITTPDRPRAEVEVYPRNPQIETEKFAVNNVSKATYEVGDTINYTIRVRGVVNDTYLENLTITDTLPAGLKYVPNSLKVDGASVTDADDSDAGYSVTGQVYGSFSNVKGTDWHTLEFQAVIERGTGGQTIQNTALVEGDNIVQPGEPTEKIVVEPEPPVDPPVEPPVNPPVDPPVNPDPPTDPADPTDPPVDPVDPPVTPPVGPGNGGGDGSGDVTPRSPIIESEKAAKDLNGGNIEVGDTIEYTIRARNTVSGSQVTSMVISDKLPAELEYVAGTLKVNGVSVTDSADGDRGDYVNGTVKGSFGTVTDTAWYTLEFQAKIIKGEHGDVIKNVGEVSGSNLNIPSRPSEEITINDPNSADPAPVLESGKEAKDLNGGTIQVGDVIEYTIRTRNTTPNTVKNLKISDELPSELKYVAGSLKVDGQSVSDAQDTDKGSYADGIVSGQFGNVTDTAWHTIVFRAEVAAGQAGQTIRNVGEVTGDNLVIPDHPYEDIIIGGGSGSNPVIPGDQQDNDGTSTDKPSNPGSGDSDSKTPDSNHSGGSNGSDDTAVGGESDGTEQSSQSGASNDSLNAESGDRNGNKLPNTATNMYSYMLAGFILLLAGLFLIRRRKA